ncbi:hypothetical protein NEOLEDRAFT_550231 [Neolentinus lepideus HHB14362 ss-1]|uniref:Ubiquitin-like domain-containing protein n=1 Tax=Neolentinus lepideus HHB14362 ss-1 TaxID=1314782 RepID=A0A165R9C5_9AGAM|nr:hypothetical protein NEOLEDRAFT_550231 [Neolentinus lepideus HHB14362 ss-1]
MVIHPVMRCLMAPRYRRILQIRQARRRRLAARSSLVATWHSAQSQTLQWFYTITRQPIVLASVVFGILLLLWYWKCSPSAVPLLCATASWDTMLMTWACCGAGKLVCTKCTSGRNHASSKMASTRLPPKVNLFIQGITPKSTVVVISPYETIHTVLRSLRRRHLLPDLSHVQYCIFFQPYGSRPLNDDDVLEAIGIRNNSTLHVRASILGGARFSSNSQEGPRLSRSKQNSLRKLDRLPQNTQNSGFPWVAVNSNVSRVRRSGLIDILLATRSLVCISGHSKDISRSRRRRHNKKLPHPRLTSHLLLISSTDL